VQGDVDIGNPTNSIASNIVHGVLSSIPIRILSNVYNLKGFDITVTYDPVNLENINCIINPAWVGGCNVETPGSIKITGINSAFSDLGDAYGINVAHIGMQGKANGQGILSSWISGTVNEVRAGNGILLSNTVFESGNIPVLVDTGVITPARRLLATQETVPDSSRKLLSTEVTGPLFGDVNGDEAFTLADLLFIQQYYNSAPTLGCPVDGGDQCQNREDLGPWQLKQLAPIGESTTGARDIPYLIGVFLENLYFVGAVDIFTIPLPVIMMKVRLLDRFSAPINNPATVRVLFALNTVQTNIPWSDGIVGTYDSDKNIEYAYGTLCLTCPDPGWFIINAVTGFAAETNVGVAFAMEKGVGKSP
jgi:hypothetical protein